MKANEFIKEFGWDEANSFVNCYGGDTSFKFLKVKEQTISVHSGDQPYDFHIDDLKRYVEAYEFVGKYESLSSAKSHLDKIRFNIATKTWFGQALLNWSIYAEKLDQAIILVEQCQ